MARLGRLVLAQETHIVMIAKVLMHMLQGGPGRRVGSKDGGSGQGGGYSAMQVREEGYKRYILAELQELQRGEADVMTSARRRGRDRVRGHVRTAGWRGDGRAKQCCSAETTRRRGRGCTCRRSDSACSRCCTRRCGTGPPRSRHRGRAEWRCSLVLRPLRRTHHTTRATASYRGTRLLAKYHSLVLLSRKLEAAEGKVTHSRPNEPSNQ